MKLYFLPLCVAVILWGCGHDKEKKREDSEAAKAEYVVSNPWDDLTALTYETKRDDCLWVVMSRRERVSYHPAMSKVPAYMEQFFADNSFVLVYPVQAGDTESWYI